MRGLATALAASALLALSATGASAQNLDARLERAFFGGESAVSTDLRRVPFWTALLAREGVEPRVQSSDWSDDPLAAARAINAVINRAPYVADEGDQWLTTQELLRRGGDCEDYASAKYFALRAAGAPAHALRIAIVADEQTGQRHAILLMAVGGEILALDNLSDVVASAASLSHYRPLLALNEEQWWFADEGIRRPPLRASAALPLNSARAASAR